MQWTSKSSPNPKKFSVQNAVPLGPLLTVLKKILNDATNVFK
jgi:hypothetical protein